MGVLEHVCKVYITPNHKIVAAIIGLARDGDPHAMLAGILPFIAHDTLGAALGVARSTPFDGTSLHELVEDHCLVPLSRCQDKGHQLAIPFRPQVDFGTETAPAPT
jgi:hypothetical protein